mmetsp:Transcript_19466/g.67115  ORF Transcript_19466/g.67115 Transcript_19466/m.67115 type:complete len:434 (-) Transcript_19466:674-1975(-)
MQTISDEMRAPLRKAALELAYADALARAHCGASPEFGYLSLYTNSTSGRNSRASMQGSFAALPNFPNRNLQLPAAFQVAAPQWAEPLSPSSNSTAMFSLRPVPANALGAEALLDYDWDLLAADEAGVVDAVVAMFAYHGSLVHHDVSPRKLQGFIEMVAENYHAQNPYHNFEHGVSVMHCCFVTLTKSKRCVAALSPLDIFALKVAAFCHDIDHPGWNNDFEVNSESPRAMLYNDMSVLENHHASFLFKTLRRRPELDIFAALATDEQRYVRQLVVGAILGTDMSKHADVLEKMQSVTTVVADLPDNGEEYFREPPNRQFLIEVVLHFGDMANQAAGSFATAKQWGLRVMDEFKAQAKRRRAAPFVHSRDPPPPASRARCASRLAQGPQDGPRRRPHLRRPEETARGDGPRRRSSRRARNEIETASRRPRDVH